MTGPEGAVAAKWQAAWRRPAGAVASLVGGVISLIYGTHLVDGGDTSDKISGWLVLIGGIAMLLGGAILAFDYCRRLRAK